MITITLESWRLRWLLDHLDVEAMRIQQDLMSEDSLKDGIRLVENKEELEMINSITNTIQEGGMI
tara:strand:+ start:301 stop:495 length:195 start_codon:yes stop_codon:yes gene_type:complete